MKLWKWIPGRQEKTEYYKFPLWQFRILMYGFDAYILRYPKNTILRWHKDPIEDAHHWRLNIKLSGDAEFTILRDGQLRSSSSIFQLFRPDKHYHSLKVYSPTLKLSFGFVKFKT